MQTVDLIISPRWILPMTGAQNLLTEHSIVVHQGKILDILPNDTVKTRYQAETQRDMPTHLLMPGFVNAHAHTPMSLFRGLADDLALMDWLTNYIWPAEKAVINAETVEIGCKLSMAEMIRSGTTCFSDHYFFPNVIAKSAVDAGMRAVVGNVFMNVPTDWAQDEAGYVNKAVETIEAPHPHALITWSIAPHAPYTNSDSSLTSAKTLADKHDLVVHMHVHETEGEANIDVRPLKRLDDLGLLNKRFIAVHMTALTDEEIELIAERQVSIVHCPESNMKLASGFAPVQRLLDAGINVALGTDGAASNNDLDMMGELRTAALIAKGFSGDPTAVSAYTALELATINGAKALGLGEQTGSLEVGKQADMIAIEMDNYTHFPVFNPVSHITYAINSRQVTDSWVSGRALLANGQLTTLDTQHWQTAAEPWVKKIAALSHLKAHNETLA
jgi:5-methylthioadenosine/S-adenosylhomocysteine deaminase